MKKLFFSAVVLVCLVGVMGADFRTLPHILMDTRDCAGYTIIEFDKAIDCDGDTIRLIRKNGFAQRILNDN